MWRGGPPLAWCAISQTISAPSLSAVETLNVSVPMPSPRGVPDRSSPSATRNPRLALSAMVGLLDSILPDTLAGLFRVSGGLRQRAVRDESPGCLLEGSARDVRVHLVG